MDLKRLQDFVVLAEELHFARAAARVGTDQSGLSRRIRELERELAAKLFLRTTRGTRLAAAGEALLPLARAILSKMEQANQAVRQSASGAQEQLLRIGICDETPLFKLSGLLTQLRLKERGIQVQLIERSCTGLIQDLQAGALDIALGLGPTNDPRLRSAAVWTDHAQVLLNATHPLAAQKAVELKDFPQESLLIVHRQCGCGMRTELEKFNGSANTQARLNGADGLNALLLLVHAGAGIGVISSAQTDRVPGTEFVTRPLRDSPVTFKTFVLYHKDNDSPAAAKFFELASRMQ